MSDMLAAMIPSGLVLRLVVGLRGRVVIIRWALIILAPSIASGGICVWVESSTGCWLAQCLIALSTKAHDTTHCRFSSAKPPETEEEADEQKQEPKACGSNNDGDPLNVG